MKSCTYVPPVTNPVTLANVTTTCTACHGRHEFSAAQARTPDTCGKCHMGPDHPQIEIYNESKHGIAYRDLHTTESSLEDIFVSLVHTA